MNCMDLRGVAPELRGVDVRRGDEPLLSARVRRITRGTPRPFTEGLDVGELVGRERKYCRDCSERATEPRRLAHVRTAWPVPGTQTARTRARRNLVRSLTRVRPNNTPSLVGEQPRDRQTGGRHRCGKTKPHGREVRKLKAGKREEKIRLDVRGEGPCGAP